MDGDKAEDTAVVLGGPMDNKLSRLIYNARNMGSAVKELIPEDWTVAGRGLEIMALLVGMINAQDEQAGSSACQSLVSPVPVGADEGHLLGVWLQRWKGLRAMCVRCRTEPPAVQLRESLVGGVQYLPTLEHAVKQLMEEHHASATNAVAALLLRLEREAKALSSKKMQMQDSWVLLPSDGAVPKPKAVGRNAQAVQLRCRSSHLHNILQQERSVRYATGGDTRATVSTSGANGSTVTRRRIEDRVQLRCVIASRM